MEIEERHRTLGTRYPRPIRIARGTNDATGSLPASSTDPDVMTSIAMFGFTSPPTYLDYKDFGYAPDWCHVSAKHRALNEGGRRVHGWALWQFDGLILGDHHSVWETTDGMLVDVTPPKYGADRILFVRDDSAKIEEENGFYVLFVNRSSLRNAPFFWQGQSTEFTVWLCPPDKPDLVAYCERWGLPVHAMLTESEYG